MKTYVFILLCVISFSVSKAQDKALEGTWNVIELIKIDYQDTLKRSPKYIKDNKAIWELTFSKTGQFKQTSNMNPTQILNSYEGNWKSSQRNLLIQFSSNSDSIEMNYNYEVNKDTLLLRRSSQEGNHRIVAKFQKK